MKQHFISTQDISAWQAALEPLAFSFYHTAEHCKAMEQAHGHPIFLYHLQHKDQSIVCPYAIREYQGKKDVYTPLGFAGFSGSVNIQNWYMHWHDFMKQQGFLAAYTFLHPIFQRKLQLSSNTILHAEKPIHIINLMQPQSRLLNNMHAHHQRNLKKWFKQKYYISTDKQILLPEFINLFRITCREFDMPSIYHFNDKVLHQLLNNPNVLLIGVSDNQHTTPKAIISIVKSPYIADFFLTACTLDSRYHSLALLWHAILYCKQLNIPYFNLSGGAIDKPGLDLFKRRLGGKILLTYSMREIFNPATYQDLCYQRGTRTDSEQYFPAYHQRQNH
ncbi:MAG: hypothetical protein Tsb005_16870 [Gammaproteobacteria bacterium]